MNFDFPSDHVTTIKAQACATGDDRSWDREDGDLPPLDACRRSMPAAAGSKDVRRIWVRRCRKERRETKGLSPPCLRSLGRFASLLLCSGTPKLAATRGESPCVCPQVRTKRARDPGSHGQNGSSREGGSWASQNLQIAVEIVVVDVFVAGANDTVAGVSLMTCFERHALRLQEIVATSEAMTTSEDAIAVAASAWTRG
ncbi:hypothetical protein MLD38_000643 [Melastoma candidum]|uniref:Uncharacterized protein n=1 Tax=Melastoma candidum TaxID=119954 RepID=A0ACB9SAT3_9MYRT|nr:hypothetical protein MLD38_000643 [Melastoma candidum]